MRMCAPTVLCGAYTLILLISNVRVLGELVDHARGNPTASHVVLVPFVTLALLYQSRTAIFATCRPAWRGGLSVVLVGLSLLLAGRVCSSSLLPEDSLSMMVGGIVISLVGGFVLFFGWEAFRAAFFPLMFLGAAVPLPNAVVGGVTEFLKRGSSEVVASLFALTGTPFHRSDFVFSLPSVVIEVADECSGIRSSIALVLTGVLAGHALLRSWWTKVLLMLAIVPMVVLKNGLRIVSLSLLAIHVDPAFLVGQLHHEGGVVFFLAALVFLAPFLPFLRRLEALHPGRSEALLSHD